MPKAGVLALLLPCLAGAGQAAQNTPSFDPHQIESEIRSGQIDSAAGELEDEVKRHADRFSAHLLLGIVRGEQGRIQESIAELQRARDLRPQDPAPYVNLGRVLLASGKYTDADHALEKAVHLDPASQTAHANLGYVYMRQLRWSEAATQLTISLRLDPTDKETRFRLLQCYLAQSNFNAAEMQAQPLFQTSPTSETYLAVGALQASAGDYQHAERNLLQARALDPASPEVTYNLGLASLRAGHPEKALPFFEQLRDQNESGEAESLLGETYEALHRPLDAVRAYQKAALLDQANEDYTFDLICELLRHRNYDEAAQVAAAAEPRFQASVRIFLAHCAALYGVNKIAEASALLAELSGRFRDDALPLYVWSVVTETEGAPVDSQNDLFTRAQDFVARHPDNATAWLVLGKVLAWRQPSDAMTALHRSLVLDGNRAESHLLLARLYFSEEQWQSAVEQSRKATELDPSLALAWYRLAQAYYHLGRRSEGDRAMATFQLRSREENENSTMVKFVSTLK